MSKYGIISGPYFSVFGLNTYIWTEYEIFLRKSPYAVQILNNCTEYGDLFRKSPYSVQIQQSTDDK